MIINAFNILNVFLEVKRETSEVLNNLKECSGFYLLSVDTMQELTLSTLIFSWTMI